MVTFMKENLLLVKLMDMANIHRSMVKFMKENGGMINLTAKVNKGSMMGVST